MIHANGGTVYTGVGVDRIVVEDGRATGVVTDTGEAIPTSTVVSNADLKRTFLELVGPEHLSRRLWRRLDRFRMALPLFTVYLAVDVDLTEHLPNTNYWSLPDADVEGWYQRAYRGELPERLPMFISSASVKDPGNPHTAPEGHATLEVMTIVPPHHELWAVEDDPADSTAYRRSDGYRSLKQRLTDQLVTQAEELIPAIRGHIVHREAATPITQERFTRSTGGACYGLELSIDQMGPLRPSPITEIDGLYLTGASTMFGAGILRGHARRCRHGERHRRTLAAPRGTWRRRLRPTSTRSPEAAPTGTRCPHPSPATRAATSDTCGPEPQLPRRSSRRPEPANRQRSVVGDRAGRSRTPRGRPRGCARPRWRPARRGRRRGCRGGRRPP